MLKYYVFYILCWLAYRRKKYDYVIIISLSIPKDNRLYYKAQYLQGCALISIKRYSEAAEVLHDLLLNLVGDRKKLRRKVARELERLRAYTEENRMQSRVPSTKSTKTGPFYKYYIWYIIAVVLYYSKQYDIATILTSSVPNYSKVYFKAQFLLGRTLISTKKYADASGVLESLLSSLPNTNRKFCRKVLQQLRKIEILAKS